MRSWFPLLLLVIYCTIVGGDFIFPSKSFTVCAYRDSTATCSPKIALIALISPNSALELEFVLDETNPLVDEKGRKWAPDTPINVRIVRDRQFTQANYFYLNSFQNAYESRTLVSSCSGLLNCCYDSISKKFYQYILRNNATIYDTYAISSQQSYTAFRITASQNSIYSVTLDDSRPTASLPGISASIITTPVNYFYQFLTTYLITPRSSPLPEKSYFIDRSFFGSSRNKLGISSASYYKDCTAGDSVSVTTVLTSDRFNQLDGFTVGLDVMENCNLRTTSTLFSSRSATVSYACNNQRSASLYLDLITNGTNFKVKKLFGDPIILNSGLIPYSLQDTLVTLFVDVMNKGSTMGTFSLQFLQLCLEDSGNFVCTSDQNIPFAIIESIDGISTKRMQTRIKADVLFNQKGYYDVQLVQDGYVELQHRILFNTREYFVGVSVSTNRPCLAPNFTMTVNGIKYCRMPCASIDTLFDVSKLSCVNVDCVTKYSRTRNYFNPITQLCEPVTTCSSSQVYDSFSNTCKQAVIINAGGGSGASTSSNIPNTTEWYNTASNNVNSVQPANCGAHGFATKDNTSCICHAGWVTNALTAQQQKLFCTDVDYNYWRNQQSSTNSSVSASAYMNINVLDNFFASIQGLDPAIQLVLFIGFVIALAVVVVILVMVCLGCCVVVRKTGIASSLPKYIIKSAIRYSFGNKKDKKKMTRKEKWKDFFKGLRELFVHNVRENNKAVGKWWKQKLKKFNDKDVPECIEKQDDAWKEYLVEMIKEQLDKRDLLKKKQGSNDLPPIPSTLQKKKEEEEEKRKEEIIAQITKSLQKYMK